MAQIVNNIALPAGGGLIIANNRFQAAGNIQGQPVFTPCEPYTETHSVAGVTEATMHGYTSWDFVDTFPQFVLGDATFEGGKIKRQLPLLHPSKPWLWADECRLLGGKGATRLKDSGMIEFFDNTGTAPTSVALWAITFVRPPYYVVADNAVRTELERYTVMNTAISMEALGLPGNAFKWKDTGIDLPEGVAIQRGMMPLEYRWIRVPDAAALQVIGSAAPKCVGKVNSKNFPPDLQFEPGKVFCLPPEQGDLYATPSGNLVRDLRLSFLVRLDSTWNQFFRRTAPSGFIDVVSNEQGKPPPFDSADLMQMFLAPAV